MKAPEKLYVDAQYNLDDSCLWGFIEKSGDEDIEYTRTDAFIEKALMWMIKQGGINDVLSREMIGDFKNYMKGE